MSLTAAQLMVMVGADIADMEAQLKKASGGFQGFADGLISNGTKMTALVTLPLAALGTQAVKATADFETNMNVLQATSGASGAELDALRKQAMALGKDLTLPATSSADAAEAMLELAKAGLATKDVLASTRGVLEMSAAGNLGNAAAAEIAANALNAFNLKGEETGRVADLLAASANSSSAEIRDVADSLKMASAVAASAGMPIEDLVTMIGEMANAGIKGSDAGTSLKQMLLSLQAPTDKAKNLMTDLGISVYDVNGQMVPARDIISRVQGALGDLTQEQRNAALATIFGADAVRAANVVMMGGVEAFDKMKASVTEEGAAAELAGARMKGLGGSIEKLQSALETAGQAAVQPFMKDLTSLIDGAAELVNAFADLDEDSRKTIGTLILLAAGTGPAITGIGAVAKVTGNVVGTMSVLPGIVKDAAASYQLLRGGMSAVEVAALSTGGLVVTLGAVAVAVGSVVAVWYTWNQEISKTNEQGLKAVGNGMSDFVNKLAAGGKDAGAITNEFVAAQQRMRAEVAKGGIAGLFVDTRGIARESLAALNPVIKQTSDSYKQYVNLMIEAGMASGTLHERYKQNAEDWQTSPQALDYLTTTLGLVSQAEYEAAEGARQHGIFLEEKAQRIMDGATTTELAVQADKKIAESSISAAWAAEQQASATVKLKDLQLQLVDAQNDLATAQQNWSKGAGGEVVGILKEANLGADTYLKALDTVDAAYGTGFGNQERQTRTMKDLVAEYKKTGDLKAFETGLGDIQKQFMPLNEDVQKAYNVLQKLKDQINSFKWVQINISVGVNGMSNSSTGNRGGEKVGGEADLNGPGGANGLDIIVPGGYPDDTYPVRASSGERVVILPQDQVGASIGGGVNVNMYMTVNGPMDIQAVAYEVASYLSGRA